ncbi:glycosyltransferase [Arhodomonas sp. KWT2]|nr:glycosyltransferase [Arhodomonas sp. KWT]
MDPGVEEVRADAPARQPGEGACAGRLAILITDQGDGGVERMLVHTANALAARGVAVHLLVADRDQRFLDRCDDTVALSELEAGSSVDAVRRFLEHERPAVLISAKLRDDRIAADARDAAGSGTRVFFRVGNPLVHRLRQGRANPLRRWRRRRQMARLYRRADGVIAVSGGIADDLVDGLGVPRSRIRVLPNPTITAAVHDEAREAVVHPWFQGDGPPVILAIGGLRRQKNFASLVRAFARVRGERAARLVILGDGRQRERLLALARRLDVAGDVDLPGWQPNPYAFMARAAVFVSCSRWEGSPNVLVEAAALGVPLVAADCISGPREILEGGRLGHLVPVDDAPALAAAIDAALREPAPAEMTRRAAEPYQADNSAQAYIDALPLYRR